MLTTFFAEFKARNVRKTMAIYISTALTTIGILKLFAETYNLPTSIFPIVVTLFACGFGSAMVFGWYHGKEGQQRFEKKEIVFHALVLLIAGIISFRVAGTPAKVAPHRPGKSIAVLPFRNLSNDQDDEYFTDGIMEDILTQLSKISDLKVISRTSVMKYKNRDSLTSIREIGEELGVASILEGSVQRYGNRVRITGQLIRSETDSHIWAENYDRELKDVFAIQSEVAQNIAAALKAQLSPDEVARVTAEPTKNLDAYALFLRGRDYRNRKNNEDNERAVELLRKATTLDPDYAAAYAELGYAFVSRYLSYGSSSDWADSGIALAQRAIQLDTGSVDGYHTIGKGYEAKGKLSLALEYYKKAIALSPSYAPAVGSVGWIAFYVGKVDEALELLRKSIALAPDFASRYVNVGTMYTYLNEDSLALLWYRKALELQGDLRIAHWALVYHYVYGGKFDQARASAQSALAKFPTDASLFHAAGDVELLTGNMTLAREYYEKSVALSSIQDGPGNQLAFTLLKLGKAGEAMKILDSNLVFYKRESTEAPEDFNYPIAVATIYSIKNNPEEALLWLNIAIERGCRDYRWFAIEPLFANVRNTSRFRSMMNSLHANIERMRDRAREQGLFNR